MAARSGGLGSAPFDLGFGRIRLPPLLRMPSCARAGAGRGGVGRVVRCCCPAEKAEDCWLEPKKKGGTRRARAEALPSLPFPSTRYASCEMLGQVFSSKRLSNKQDFSSRCSPKSSAPESRDTPPKRGVSTLLSLSKGAEKSGENADGDSWWETWKEVLYQDEWR
ncbi:hypothetical protein BHE74_00037598 [Ensete ventricosum]|nr:hypothetical protein BHE74_00037598 [Ensete ventricosum]